MKRYLMKLDSIVRELEAWQHRYPEKLKNYPVTIECAKQVLTGLREELEYRDSQKEGDDRSLA